jgi:hypothetical protein
VDLLRQMLGAMKVERRDRPGHLVLGRTRWLNLASLLLLVALTALLGGHKVPVNDFADNTPYIGLDWFILDLLGSSLIFIFIEKLFALRKDQPVFRPEWQTDFHHFIVNHMLIGFMLLATNLLVHKLFGWALDGVRFWVQPAFPGGLFGSSWWPTWCSTGRIAPTTRCRCCGACTPCTTAPRAWTGWPARASTSWSCSSPAPWCWRRSSCWVSPRK